MKITTLIPTFIIITAIGILYDKYRSKYDPEPEKVEFDLIQKYLLNKEGFGKNDKPIMWVFTDNELNARDWKTFGSRNSKDLNQPYIHMCIETIIKWNGDSFNICLINSESFDKLLKDWTIDIAELPEPIKNRVIKLGLFRILHKYGGVLMPNSMIMLKDFKSAHEEYLGVNGCYVGEFVCRSITAEMEKTFPDSKLVGCTKNNVNMKSICSYMEKLISTDNTNETDFFGNLNRFINDLINKYAVNKVPGNLLGTKTKECKTIIIDDLLENSNIEMDKALFCIYLPSDEILKRTKYSWFARSNKIQILSSNTNVGKFFILSY
tara:strand:+ start:5507 stop:6472 length:966 start_codon:yes stop_codon:yes gene_type:complete